MAQAQRDQNHVTTLIAVSNVDGTTPVLLYADPTTHRLLVDSAGGSGTVTDVSVATANGFAGTVETSTTTPVITLTTSITGILQGNGTAVTAIIVGSGLDFTEGTLTATNNGTVTGTGTTNEISYWTSSSAIGSLTTATYPSLTELSYVKGVTSSIQTQIDAKGAGTVTSVTGTTDRITSTGGTTPAIDIAAGYVGQTSITTLGTITTGTWTGTTIAIANGGTGATSLADASIPTYTSTNTLTNKRITRRVVTTTQSATPAINTDNTDVSSITGLAQAITSMSSSLTGTPVAGDILIIEITDNGTERAITWGASFTASTVALPTTTVISTLLMVGFRRTAANSSWVCVAVA